MSSPSTRRGLELKSLRLIDDRVAGSLIRRAFVEAEGQLVARVTFVLPNCTWADAVYVVGDFNHWNRTSHPFQRDREGHCLLTVDLELGRAYQFRYLRDGEEWMNNKQADAHVSNPYGRANSVVITDPEFVPYYGVVQKQLPSFVRQ